MKNRWILIMMLILSLALTGCGSSEPQGGQVTPATEPATAETEAPDTPLSLGRIEGGTYTNTYAGFGCDLDESWTFASAEELQELPEAARNAVDGTELGEALKDVASIRDMQADNADLMANVSVQYNKLYDKMDIATRLATKEISEEDLVDGVLEGRDGLVEAYTQIGMENISIEKVKVNFLGEEHWGVKTTAESEGMTFHSMQLFNYWAGNYGITLTVGSWETDNTQTILDLFYPVN